jgi:predicted ArsR family transcriptional regulator
MGEEEATMRALDYVRDQRGARTYRIADWLRIDTQAARRIMEQLERERRAHRDPHYGAVNNIFWQVGDGRASTQGE